MTAICFLGVGFVIFKYPPTWQTELVMIFLLWLGIWWLGKTIFKLSRRGLLGATSIIGLLLIQRFEILSWISFGIWLILTGVFLYVLEMFN